jgi:hypothetical protein
MASNKAAGVNETAGYGVKSMKLSAASYGVSKRNCAEAKPAFAPARFGAVRLAIHHCSKLQCILAKANKSKGEFLWLSCSS